LTTPVADATELADVLEHSYIPMTDLDDLLSSLPCRHALVVLDCRFAGALRWSSYRYVAPAPAELHRERYRWFIEGKAWQAIASAAHNQEAIDIAGFQPWENVTTRKPTRRSPVR
jgi:hypothetical protein